MDGLRILPVVYIKLFLKELRCKAELVEWYVLQAELRGGLFAMLFLKHLVWGSGIEAGARQRVYVIHHQGNILLSKIIKT